MRINFSFEKYESKLATFISMLKSGILGLILFWIFFNIPSFIVLICGVEEPVPAILFGVMSGVAILAFIGILFIDTDKVDDIMTRKKNNVYKNLQATDIRTKVQQAYIGSLIEEEEKEK